MRVCAVPPTEEEGVKNRCKMMRNWIPWKLGHKQKPLMNKIIILFYPLSNQPTMCVFVCLCVCVCACVRITYKHICCVCVCVCMQVVSDTFSRWR
jgi:hypothetical protein